MNTSLNLVAGKFLGSRDRLLLCGNQARAGRVQIHYYQFLNGVDGKADFFLKDEIQLKNMITCVELCGIPRLTKTFLAIGGVNCTKQCGYLEIIELETKLNGASLTPTNLTFNDILSSSSAITSLVFNPERELLAVANEGGDVILLDLYAGKEIYRTRADATGVNNIKFNASGDIFSVGNSQGAPIKVWDMRYSGDTVAMSCSATVSLPKRPTSPTRHPSSDRFNSSIIHKYTTGYTSIAMHPVQQIVACGGAAGSVLLWDMRSNVPLQFVPHLSRVTDLLFHPRFHEQIISGSIDGSVRQFNYFNLPTNNSLNKKFSTFSGTQSTIFASPSLQVSTPPEYVNVVSDAFAVKSLDIDIDSSILLTVTDIGKVFRTPV